VSLLMMSLASARVDIDLLVVVVFAKNVGEE